MPVPPMTQDEKEAWVQFYCAALGALMEKSSAPMTSSQTSIDNAADIADRSLVAYRDHL